MSLPLHIPPLLRRNKHDDKATRALRYANQAAKASHSLHVDATPQHLGFLFASLVGFLFWGSFPLPPCLDELNFDGIDDKACINIIEFFGAVVSLALIAPSVAGSPGKLTHIHIYTDNTSALSWMIKYRSSHPLISSLLQIFSHIQIRHHLLVTMSHIEGKKNIFADAASREFKVPNGAALFNELSSTPQVHSLPKWTNNWLPSMKSQSTSTWQQALGNLSALTFVPVRSSPSTSASTPTPCDFNPRK